MPWLLTKISTSTEWVLFKTQEISKLNPGFGRGFLCLEILIPPASVSGVPRQKESLLYSWGLRWDSPHTCVRREIFPLYIQRY